MVFVGQIWFLFNKSGNWGTDFPKVKELGYSRIERILGELISASNFTDEETEDEQDHMLSS